MRVGPTHVGDDGLGTVVQRVAHLTGREDDVDFLGQQFEEFQREVDGSLEVVVRLNSFAKHTSHGIDVLDFCSYQLHTIERGELLGSRLQQACQRGHEADGGNGDRAVGLLGKQFAVKLVAFHVSAIVANRALEHRLGFGGAGVWRVMVGDEHVRCLHTFRLKADGDVGVAVEVVHHVHQVGIGLPHTVDDDAHQ